MDFFIWLGIVATAAFRLSIDTTQFVLFAAIVAIELAAVFVPSRFKPAVLAMSAKLSTGRMALIVLIGVIGTRLLLAPYWVWEDEHQARLLAENAIHQSNSRDAIKQHLEQFYVDVGPIITRPLEKNISEEDFKKYSNEAQAWVDNTADWIENNMGIPARERFLDRTGMMATHYSLAVNNQHNSIVANLTRLRQKSERTD